MRVVEVWLNIYIYIYIGDSGDSYSFPWSLRVHWQSIRAVLAYKLLGKYILKKWKIEIEKLCCKVNVFYFSTSNILAQKRQPRNAITDYHSVTDCWYTPGPLVEAMDSAWVFGTWKKNSPLDLHNLLWPLNYIFYWEKMSYSFIDWSNRGRDYR